MKAEKKTYELPGQKRDTPDEADSLRKFYVSLRTQKPESEMAETWLMEHGLLPEEEAKKAYKKWLAKRGRNGPPAKKSGVGGGGSSRPKSASGGGEKKKKKKASKPSNKPKSLSGMKRKATTVVDDDDDEDIPLAALKSGGGGGGFKIPKKEGGATPIKAE